MLNVYAAFRKLQGKSASFNTVGVGFASMWQDDGSVPGFEGQNKGNID